MDNELLEIRGDDVLGSGWKPPSSDDVKALSIMQGAADIDLDKVKAAKPRTTFLWIPLHIALRRYHKNPSYKWLPQYQKRGTCVGQADKYALDLIAGHNAVFYGEEFQGRHSVAGCYTFSRVEIAGQPGKWDGANGYQAAAGNMRKGCLRLKQLDLPDDSRDADEQLAVQWTATKAGVPQKYEDMAADILIGDAITLKPEDTMLAAKLIQAGCPQLIGTTYIPTGKRGKNGISPCARSRGGHEMCVDGVFYDDAPVAFHIQNSWSETWGSGPIMPDGTDIRYEPMPSGGVWVSAEDYAIMRRDGDSTALVGMNGLNYVGV